MTRQEAEKRGRGAETIAAWYLRMHGWQILARRARVPGGEVDIVAKRGRTLAFVEVKARADADTAALSLDEYRLRRVAVAVLQIDRCSLLKIVLRSLRFTQLCRDECVHRWAER